MRGSDGSERRRAFLARPFWRDYLVGAVLVGVGFMVNDFAVTARGAERWVLWVSAMVLVGVGVGILLCAVGWSLWRAVRR